MIFGVNLSHDYAHCVLNSSIVSLFEEERTSRKRYHWDESSYTLATLDRYGLDELSQAEAIYLSFPRLVQLQQRQGDLSSQRRSYRYVGEFPGLDERRRIGRGELLIGDQRIRSACVSHYHAHAYASFHSSGFDEADILCLDGGGDFGEGALFRAEGGRILLVQRLLDVQLGSSYHHFSHRVFGVGEGFFESKVMAIAAFGRPSLSNNSFMNPNGRLNAIAADVRPTVHDVAQFQATFQECVLDLLRKLPRSSDNLCCAGGVFYNVLLNQVIAQANLYRQVFVPSHVGDMGTALGAALMAAEELGHPLTADVVKSPFLGADICIGLHELCDSIRRMGDIPVPMSDEPSFYDDRQSELR